MVSFFDPLDREKIEHKIEAMSAIYQKLTTKKVSFDFAKPNSFQIKCLEEKNK
jgi:hypothetical protein